MRLEWHFLRQTIPTKHSNRHSGEGRNPEERPSLVHMDPGLRRDDGAFSLKEVPFDASPFLLAAFLTLSTAQLCRLSLDFLRPNTVIRTLNGLQVFGNMPLPHFGGAQP